MREILALVLVLGGVFNSSGLTDNEWCNKNVTFKQPAVATCKGYWECNKGNVTYKTCPMFKLFDSDKLECVWNLYNSDQVKCDEQEGQHVDDTWCSIGKTYKAPVNGLCDSYYHCQEGLLELETCTWPTKFNPKDRSCQLNIWPFSFKCYDYETTSSKPTPNPVSTTTVSSGCEQGETYSLPYPEDCSKYYRCENGKKTLQTCGFMQKFDSKEKQCALEYPWIRISCESLPLTTPTQVSTTKPTTTKKSTSVKPTAQPQVTTKIPQISAECLKGNYYTIPDKQDCQKYYECSNGSIKLKQCSTSYRFDPITHECSFNFPFYNNVNCAAKPDKPVCKKGYNYKISYPGSNKKYYDCDDGKLEIKECGTLQGYDGSTQQCRIQIFGYVLKSETQEAALSHYHGKSCQRGSYFNTTYPGDCHKYYRCNNGTLTTDECPYANKFDMKHRKCVKMTQCDLLTCNSKGPVCYPGINYLTTLPGHCDKYSECKDGQWKVKSCSWLHKFQPSTLQCKLTWFNNIDCDAQPTCQNKFLVDIVTPNKLITSPFNLNSKYEKPRCDEDQQYRTVFPYDCSKYYNCNKGKLSVGICSTFDKFDPEILDCRFDSPWNPVNCKRLPGEPQCSKGEKSQRVYPGQCDKYYECNNGTVNVEKCYFWQKFDPATLECRLSIPWIYNVNCSAVPGSKVHHIKPTIKTNVIPSNSASKSSVTGPKCDKGQKFKSVYPGDCKKYFDCANGTETTESCFWFRKFNPATLSCAWDLPFDRVNCSALPGSGLVVYPENIKINCNSGTRFKAVDDKNCKNYYSCSNGSLSYQSCGFLKKFNPQTLSCSLDLPFNRVNCSAQPGEPACPKTGTVLTPYPGDCKKYYQCSNGKLTVEMCGMMQAFDHSKHECKYDTLFTPVNCGNKS